MNNIENTVENIMNNFNFERVHRVMVALDWQYWNKGIPDIETLKEVALWHLEKVVKENFEDNIESGGFKASKHINKQGITILQLEFIVESWEHRRV